MKELVDKVFNDKAKRRIAGAARLGVLLQEAGFRCLWAGTWELASDQDKVDWSLVNEATRLASELGYSIAVSNGAYGFYCCIQK